MLKGLIIKNMDMGMNEIILHSLGISSVDVADEIQKAVRLLYHAVLELDMDSGRAVVLYSPAEGMIGREYDWDECLTSYVDRLVLPPDRMRVAADFRFDSLKALGENGKHTFSADFQSAVAVKDQNYVTMLAFLPEKGGRTAYILVRGTGGDHLTKSIINQYVYEMCDYFVYIYGLNNSYSMISSRGGVPLPPAFGVDYDADMRRYNIKYVPEEEREAAISEMRLSRIMEELDFKICRMTTGGGKGNRYARR